jgi:hypothetical protein
MDAMQPGDRRPARRQLERPPGERYGPPAAIPASPSVGRALGSGLLSAAALAVAWGLFEGLLGYDVGLLVLAAFGGWLVGASVAWGAWAGARRGASGGRGNGPRQGVTRLRGIAAMLAIMVWPAAQVVAWIATRAALPASSLDLVGRLAATPLVDFVGNTVGPIALVEVLLLALVAWFAAG